MSFTGDLEHLSIVDVVQLLHATRKSGTLTIKGRKGESQLVFDDGYITCANHFDNSVRIGNILVEAGLITTATLDEVLQEQHRAGEERRPLVATLIEKGLVRKEDAYRGLETLIELTIVEILTWKRGSFTLDVEQITLSDEYRYFPEKLHQDIHLHTENVLMDALRIFDEKRRDGLLSEDEPGDEDLPPEGISEGEESPFLSADDLGLGDLDSLERSIPRVYSPLEDRKPSAAQRRMVQEIGSFLADDEQEQLLVFLGAPPGKATAAEGAPRLDESISVILFSCDEFLTYCITSVCRREGIFVFVTTEEQDLDPIIGQFQTKGGITLLVLDAPGESGAGLSVTEISLLRQQKKAKHPQLGIVQLASPHDYSFSLQSLREGVQAVIPRPVRDERQDSHLQDTLLFLEALPSFLRRSGYEQDSPRIDRIRQNLQTLRKLADPPEVALALLQSVSGIFERSLTLIVRDTELIAERSIGIRDDRFKGASPPLRFRIPLAEPSLLRQVVDEGSCFFGTVDDEILKEHLFTAIGTPLRPTVLLLPLKSGGKTISVVYADFGKREISPVPLDFLEIIAGQAGLFVENILYRRRRERPVP